MSIAPTWRKKKSCCSLNSLNSRNPRFGRYLFRRDACTERPPAPCKAVLPPTRSNCCKQLLSSPALSVSTGCTGSSQVTQKLAFTFFFFRFKKSREAEASSATVGKHAPSKELLELALTAQQLKLFPDPSPYCLLKIWLP